LEVCTPSSEYKYGSLLLWATNSHVVANRGMDSAQLIHTGCTNLQHARVKIAIGNLLHTLESSM